MVEAEIVTLTWPEMYLASTAALMRRIGNMRRGIRAKHGAPEEEGAWEPDFFACQGEMVVAKALNLFWSGSVGDFTAVDVGGLVQVRTRRKKWHQLIVHDSDADDEPFVLVCAHASPQFSLCGWVYGREAKKPEYWSDPAGGRPAYFVPQEKLTSMADLRSIIPTMKMG